MVADSAPGEAGSAEVAPHAWPQAERSHATGALKAGGAPPAVMLKACDMGGTRQGQDYFDPWAMLRTSSVRVLLVSGWVLPIELIPWFLTAVPRFVLAGW